MYLWYIYNIITLYPWYIEIYIYTYHCMVERIYPHIIRQLRIQRDFEQIVFFSDHWRPRACWMWIFEFSDQEMTLDRWWKNWQFTIAGWWFCCHQFYFPILIGNNHPNGLSYFSEGWPNHQPDWFSPNFCFGFGISARSCPTYLLKDIEVQKRWGLSQNGHHPHFMANL